MWPGTAIKIDGGSGGKILTLSLTMKDVTAMLSTVHVLLNAFKPSNSISDSRVGAF